MTWTPIDVINFIGMLVAVLAAFVAWSKSKAERDKLEAETAQLYANLAAEGAKREKRYKADIEALEERIKHQDAAIAELKDIIEKKDERIFELETLTEKQEKEIVALRMELAKLKSTIKR